MSVSLTTVGVVLYIGLIYLGDSSRDVVEVGDEGVSDRDVDDDILVEMAAGGVVKMTYVIGFVGRLVIVCLLVDVEDGVGGVGSAQSQTFRPTRSSR